MNLEHLLTMGEFTAAALYEEPDRSLFYRKALAIRRFYEHCALHPYRGTPLYPSGSVKANMSLVPNYLTGLSFPSSALRESEPEITDRIGSEFFARYSSVPAEHCVAGNMYTHSMPHYERVLKEGLLSYAERIEKIADRDMREGLLHLIEGIKIYVNRCAEYLRSAGAEEKLIRALEKAPLYGAENIYEAVLAWNFVLYLDNCDNLGCLDRGLLPYFRGEDITDLLENLYSNLNDNGGYSMSLDSVCPALTCQCLRAARGCRRPMIEMLIDENTPEEVWNEALETVRTGGGQPAFYNKTLLFDGLKKRFPTIRTEDLDRFCGGGCTETMLAGFSSVGSLDAGINLLLILERTLHAQLEHAGSFEEFTQCFLRETEKTVQTVCREIGRSRLVRSETNPLPMRTLLIDDCIDTGREYNSGGARYNWSIINFAGMINVIDALLSVKKFVFDEQKYSAAQFLACLKNEDPAFLREMRTNPLSFGTDDQEVNAFARQLSEQIFAMPEKEALPFGEGFLSASIQFNSQVSAGKNIGATPDGRTAGAPLADSLAAIFGKDTRGPTALLNSVTALALPRALGIPVLNFNLTRKFRGETLKALIQSYMQSGGIQMQITCASREELLDACAHPDLHRNLVVRVGGYSEYFIRLSKELQQMVLARTLREEL